MVEACGDQLGSDRSFYTTADTVADIEATARQLAAAGVRFERYPGMQQDELGIWQSPGGGSVAWFKDPEGNTLSVSQH